MKTIKITPPEGFKLGKFNESTGEVKIVPIKKETTVEDINSIQDAENVLNRNFPKEQYWESESDYAERELKFIIEAVNKVDNGNKRWTINWNGNTPYYRNWFNWTKTGWVFGEASGRSSCSLGPAGLYFKNKSTAELIANKFQHLYSKMLG